MLTNSNTAGRYTAVAAAGCEVGNYATLCSDRNLRTEAFRPARESLLLDKPSRPADTKRV